MAQLHFLGAAGSVTGSKFLLTTSRSRVLIDCGLFQGPKELERLNWDSLPIPARDVHAAVLTHAHLDHAGWLPRLVAQGFDRKVYCTHGTADLLSVLLPDAGFLQEEEAAHANHKGWSRHRPARPLYTLLDAQRALRHLRPAAYGASHEVAEGVTVTFRRAGHIIGSAIVEILVVDRGQQTQLVFSGDLGRSGTELLADPETVSRADYLIVESTYGDRRHPLGHAADHLARVVRDAVARGGVLILPAFAVGRTQEVLYALRALENAGAIPVLDVYLDSPMAIDATEIAATHGEEFGAEARSLLAMGGRALAPRKLSIVRDAQQSRRLNAITGPAIIVSASGMCDGGRIKHHLAQRLPFERHTVALLGFQAAGTRGRALADGAREVWIFGQKVPVCAHVTRVEGFSAHADQAGILGWLSHFDVPPRRTFVVHGEPAASAALAVRIDAQLGWKVDIPTLGETVTLAPGGAARMPA